MPAPRPQESEMSNMLRDFRNPAEIAKVGQEIYERKHRAELERSANAQFAAIDVQSEEAYVAPTPDGAIAKGRSKAPGGLFHLIKVGALGAFRVSYTSNADSDWIFRQERESVAQN